MEDIIVDKINNKSGFTLVELLVTVSIIGVLTTVGVVFFQNSREKASDARRRHDLVDVQKAFEQYFASEGEYPSSCPSVGSSLATSDGDVVLDLVPSDPSSGASYNSNCSSDYYCYSAELSDSTAGNCAGCDCSSGTSCTFTAGTSHFCVKHKQ